MGWGHSYLLNGWYCQLSILTTFVKKPRTRGYEWGLRNSGLLSPLHLGLDGHSKVKIAFGVGPLHFRLQADNLHTLEDVELHLCVHVCVCVLKIRHSEGIRMARRMSLSTFTYSPMRMWMSVPMGTSVFVYANVHAYVQVCWLCLCVC